MTCIVLTLFPGQPVRVDNNCAESNEGYPVFTKKDFEEAVFTMKNENGPDGIPTEVYKLMFPRRPVLLLGAFNFCLA